MLAGPGNMGARNPAVPKAMREEKYDFKVFAAVARGWSKVVVGLRTDKRERKREE